MHLEACTPIAKQTFRCNYKGGKQLPRIQEWCEDNGYSEDVADLIRGLKKFKYTEDRMVDVANRANSMFKECGVSVQEIIAYLMFLHERY